MALSTLLEIRLHRAMADDRRQDAFAEGEFTSSAAGRLTAGLDDPKLRAAARWFHDQLRHTDLDPVDMRAVRAPDRLFLPFEEDGGMLAVVLSKAFLLADDASITDPSILRQLPRAAASV
ncbi:DUF7737 domain-containing protein [Streptomyces sp. NBC_00448]|uniref:DUF7737 domain-containing protein n=1 Tax=Streptomyces sp. NBC_00448 TaxID=2903652 RepID=UPI002E1B6F5E